jgi:hypothetical protein
LAPVGPTHASNRCTARTWIRADDRHPRTHRRAAEAGDSRPLAKTADAGPLRVWTAQRRWESASTRSATGNRAGGSRRVLRSRCCGSPHVTHGYFARTSRRRLREGASGPDAGGLEHTLSTGSARRTFTIPATYRRAPRVRAPSAPPQASGFAGEFAFWRCLVRGFGRAWSWR